MESKTSATQIEQIAGSKEWQGRWIWKSGKTKSGHGVPWNVQILNSNPQNYLWEKDKINIVVVTPGLYEISFGFFSKNKSSVTAQVLLNGHPVLSAAQSTTSASVQRTHEHVPHPAGNVSGVSLIDFLALPPKSRLALSYSGDLEVEAFLSLKKL